jgi:hypothetical protein
MPIDLLEGKKPPVKIKRENLPEDIELHIPEKQRLLKAQKPLPPKKEKPQKVKPALPPKENLPAVNLMKSFRFYLLKRRLTFTSLLVIITIVVFGGISVYFLYFYKPKQKIVINTNLPVVNVNIPIVALPVVTPSPVETPKIFCGDGICQANESYTFCPSDCQAPPPLPPPSPPPPSLPSLPPQPLPNTELAPLRGSLVKFKDESIIYLVELNGELRKVDLATVYFANGQKVTEVSTTLIYTINDSFKKIRRGKDVFGKVEWDPRILSPIELESFK